LQGLAAQRFARQVLYLQQVIAIWMLLVVYGCFGLFGNGFSTLSAQSENEAPRGQQDDTATLARPRSRRRGRRGQLKRGENGDGSDTSDIAASYARYSSGMQREASTADQHRKNLELATKNGHRIPLDLQFADEKLSGTKLWRETLNAMLRSAETVELKTLYLYWYCPKTVDSVSV
jgi:hypothetical protein